MSKKMRLIGLFLALFLWGLPEASQANHVAVKGEESPEAGFLYQQLGDPVVSDDPDNKVAFTAIIKSDGILPALKDNCIFKVEDADTGAAVACKGDDSPDGRKYLGFSDVSINAGGEVAWASRLTGGRNGVFRGDPAVVFFTGDPVPGPAVGLLKQFSLTVITDNGNVVARAAIQGGAGQGLFRCPPGGDCTEADGDAIVDGETLVLKGASVPDRPDQIFCEFTHLDASDYGIVFRAKTTDETVDPDCDAPDRTGVFRFKFGDDPDTDIVTIALEDELSNPYCVIPGGTRYDEISGAPSINNDGVVAFRAATRGLLRAQNLYLCDPADCPVIADPDDCTLGDVRPEVKVAAGDSAACGGVFGDFSPPALSDAGDIAFRARSTGNNLGIYIWDSASDTTDDVVCKDDPVADMDAEYTSFEPPAMSTGGKVVFKAGFKRTVGTPKQGSGIFLFE